MHDLVIRNGKIVDGSGAPAFTGDVAIDDGVITSVGAKAGAARREIDASGPRRHAGMGRYPHPLRRPGHVGSVPQPFELARRYDDRDGQLRSRLCAGPAGPAGISDRADGRRRGHPRQRALRRNQVGLGIVSRIHERDREDAARARRWRANAARLAAHLRDGRARRAQRGSDARRHREDGGARARFAQGRRAGIHHLAHDAASREEQGSRAGNFRQRG